MRVNKASGDGEGYRPEAWGKSPKKGRAKQIDLPKLSDLPPIGGRKTDIGKVEANAKKLKKMKLPSVLNSCCTTAIEEKGLYFKAEKGGNENHLIRSLFKKISGR